MRKFFVKEGPFVYHFNSTHKMMKHLLIALLPILCFAFYKNGIVPYQKGNVNFFGLLYPIIFLLTSVLTSVLLEALYMKFILKKEDNELKEALKNSHPIFTGIFLALISPIQMPLYLLIIGNFMATIIGKMLEGGFGKNRFNPALIGKLGILILCRSMLYPMYEISTPIHQFIEQGNLGSYDTLIVPYKDMTHFILGMVPGNLGDTSILLCGIALCYLIIMRVIKWKIPLIYISTVFFMIFFIGSQNNLGIWYPLYHLAIGGTLFCAVFMATDPVTSPTTSIGQIIYALFLGILTVFFRFVFPMEEGVFISILLMNLWVPFFDRLGSSSRIAILKVGIPLIIGGIIVCLMSCYIATLYI